VLNLLEAGGKEDKGGCGEEAAAGLALPLLLGPPWVGPGRVDERGERGPPPCCDGTSPHSRLPMSFNFTDHQSMLQSAVRQRALCSPFTSSSLSPKLHHDNY
jgi:hypothetical protein